MEVISVHVDIITSLIPVLFLLLNLIVQNVVKLSEEKIIFFTESFEIPCGFLRSRKTSGIMISHMHSGLINVGRPSESPAVSFKHQNPLALFPAVYGTVQSVQAPAYDDLVVIHRSFLGLYLPAAFASSMFMSCALPLIGLILVGVFPVLG